MLPFTPIALAALFIMLFSKDLSRSGASKNEAKKEDKPKIVISYEK